MASIPTTETVYVRNEGDADDAYTAVTLTLNGGGTAYEGTYNAVDGNTIEVAHQFLKTKSVVNDVTIVAGSITDVSASYGASITINGAAGFSAGTNPVYSLDTAPSFLSVNPSTGSITGTAPSVDSTDTVTLRATNSISTATVSFNLTVQESAFAFDADTYWWDFTSTSNDIETTGDDTISYAPDLLADALGMIQTVKSDQPLVTANGFTGNQQTRRQLIGDIIGNPSSLSNGKNGWYFAANILMPASALQGGLFNISRNASSVPSRGQIYITGSRNFAVKAANNDGSTVSFVGYGPALTLGTWYTLEMRWTCNPNTLEIWHDGVLQTLASGPTGTFNATFPATNPSEISIGNIPNTDADSFNGEIQQIIFHDGVPNNTIRQSISDYLNSVRP